MKPPRVGAPGTERPAPPAPDGHPLDAADGPVAERAAPKARRPTGRLVPAGEVAAVVRPASPAAASATGSALAVDGETQGPRPRPAAGS